MAVPDFSGWDTMTQEKRAPNADRSGREVTPPRPLMRACSAAASSRDPLPWWSAIRASASPPCSCSCSRPWPPRTSWSSMSPARNPPNRSGCGRTGWPLIRKRSMWPRRTASRPSSPWPRTSSRRCWQWIPSRPCTARRLPPRPAASPRCGSQPPGSWPWSREAACRLS